MKMEEINRMKTVIPSLIITNKMILITTTKMMMTR